MKLRTIRTDPAVKPFWKNAMEWLWWISILLLIVRGILKIKNKAQQTEPSEFEHVVDWFFLVFVLLFIIPGMVYWIKPSLFRNKLDERTNNNIE